MSDAELLRSRLKELDDVPYPGAVERIAAVMQGVELLVATEESGSETVTHFTVGKDAYDRSWIYAYLDEAALRRGTVAGQQYSIFLFDDLVEIASANGFGGIIVDQFDGNSSALLPGDYFDLALAVLRAQG